MPQATKASIDKKIKKYETRLTNANESVKRQKARIADLKKRRAALDK